MNRIALPARRPALRERIVYRRPDGAELWLYVTAGFHPDTKQLLEVFIRPRGNVDTDLCRYFDDIGVLISRCLQHGDTLQDLASGMGRLPGEPRAAHSPIGAVIDALIALRHEVERTWPLPADYIERSLNPRLGEGAQAPSP